MNDKPFAMDLPINFPPGTRFWQLIIDAVADLTTGEFMLLDGSIVAGDSDPTAALRRRIERDGVEISEHAFRELAPPSLAEWLKAISDRAKRDPEFAKALGVALADEDSKENERIASDALQNAVDPADQREGARLLLKIAAKKQNMPDQ